MSSPPRTPTRRPTSSHRRHPSSLDMSYSTSPLRRRSSGYSPVTPRSSTHEFDNSSPAQHFDGGAGGGDSGLGNLADELGDVWDEDDVDGEYMDEEDVEDMEAGEDGEIGVAVEHDGSAGGGNSSPVAAANGGVRDSGVVLQSSSSSSPTSKKASLSPVAAAKAGAARRNQNHHQRQRSLYDGSDYGGDSDLEEHGGVSAGLDRQMAAVESLVRRGLEENGSPSDQVVKRVVERLRDLGSQTSIESGAARLKTAHDALSTHLSHQSRMLSSITVVFAGPRAIYADPDTIDALLPLIHSTLELMPHASPEPLYAVSQLTSSTRELLQHLSNVSDSLHMSRQAHNDASRRLRVAKEQVADWKRETELREQGIRSIDRGNWDKRIAEREAGTACREVVDGFEEVCGMWRKRLCEGLGVAG